MLTSTITGNECGIETKAIGKAPEEPKARGGKYSSCCNGTMKRLLTELPVAETSILRAASLGP